MNHLTPLLLLLLLPTILSFPPPPPPPTPLAALPPPYIPLKEWKQRKLDHLQHRVHPPPRPLHPLVCFKQLPFLPRICPLTPLNKAPAKLNLTVPLVRAEVQVIEQVLNGQWTPQLDNLTFSLSNITKISNRSLTDTSITKLLPSPTPTSSKVNQKLAQQAAQKRAEKLAQKLNQKPFNFASADAGARILSHSPHILGAKNILVSHEDKYLVAPCHSTTTPPLMRWVDIELSEELVLESIEIANHEYYSSSPRTIAILGAAEYPPKEGWAVVGVFGFRHVRKTQRFVIDKRGIVRYLRVVFAGVQGGEYYCPISCVRVFGKSLIADWKDFVDKPSRANGNSNQALANSIVDHDTDAMHTPADGHAIAPGSDEIVSEDDAVVLEAVRGGTLTPIEGDDNIFRKVTRMIRLLELNQTLTNQYIDTQLSRFATALRDSYTCAERVGKRAESSEARMQLLVIRLERRVDEMHRHAFRRDVVICVLVVVIAFLLGGQWVVWTAMAGGRIVEEEDGRRSSFGFVVGSKKGFDEESRSVSSVELWKGGVVLSEVSGLER